jgi:hypothetical protein
MDTFLNTNDLLKLNQEDTNNLNRSIMSNKMETNKNASQKRKAQNQID